MRASRAGEPFTELRRRHLVATEVGVRRKIRPIILPRFAALDSAALILVDMSGRNPHGGRIVDIQSRLRSIIDSLLARQRVALAAFDGRPGLHILQAMTRDRSLLRAAVANLGRWQVKDPSRNFYGAYLAGLKLLDTRTQPGTQFRLNTMVVITNGGDLAGRAKHDVAYSAVEKSFARGVQLVTVGVGPKVSDVTLEEFGPTDFYHYRTISRFDPAAVRKILDRLRKNWSSHYVVAYCSTTRAGKQAVTVSLRGNANVRVTHRFNAAGFKPGCDLRQLLTKCRYIQCGGPPGSACRSCLRGMTCVDHQCVPSFEVKRWIRRKRLAQSRADARFRRLGSVYKRQYLGCRARNADRRRKHRQWQVAERAWRRSDCGLQISLELGSRAYPVPKGVGGALLLGWSFRRYVELHLGAAFSIKRGGPLLQVRFKPVSYRSLDFIVAPRLSTAFSQDTTNVDFSLLVGLRVRIGRYLGLHLMTGPGYTYGRHRDLGVTKDGFFLPFWVGAEARL